MSDSLPPWRREVAGHGITINCNGATGYGFSTGKVYWPSPAEFNRWAAFIVNEEGMVLLVKHTYGRLNWELPGGGAEIDESPVEMALREVREETGLAVVAHHMTGYYYAPENDSLHFVFWCKQKDPTATPEPDSAEISECRFWSPETLPRPISDWTVRRIQNAISGNTFGLPINIGERVWLK